jgi:hypothetical protein
LMRSFPHRMPAHGLYTTPCTASSWSLQMVPKLLFTPGLELVPGHSTWPCQSRGIHVDDVCASSSINAEPQKPWYARERRVQVQISSQTGWTRAVADDIRSAKNVANTRNWPIFDLHDVGHQSGSDLQQRDDPRSVAKCAVQHAWAAGSVGAAMLEGSQFELVRLHSSYSCSRSVVGAYRFEPHITVVAPR